MKIIAPIETVFRLSEVQRRALRKLRIPSVEDLLYHFPSRYGDVAEVRNIESLQKGETAVVFGTISKLEAKKAFYKKIPMGTAELRDDSGKIQIVWFNQPYLAKMIPEGALVRVEGKVSQRRSKNYELGIKNKEGALYFSNPKIERVTEVPTGVGDSLFGATGESHHLHPVYPESRGVSSNWFFHSIQKVIASGVLDSLTDPIPDEILKKYHLPSLKTALIWIHAPKKAGDAVAARKRFAFEEVFFIQLEKQKERKIWQSEPSFRIDGSRGLNADSTRNNAEQRIQEFCKRFPFDLTNTQKRAIDIILADFKKEHPMARLLEGDVGSGKTAVAAATAYAVVTAGRNFLSSASNPHTSASVPRLLQVAYMCPTEILARQQFENFVSFFSHLPINIGLITSSGCQKFPSKLNADFTRTGRGPDPSSRADLTTGRSAGRKTWTDISKSQLLKWVANGEIPILIGTHALIQKNVQFKHLAYVIIDEQHRFGVNQRKALIRGHSRGQVADSTPVVERSSLRGAARTEEKTAVEPLLYRDVTYRIREAIFRVKKELGLGHKEIVYQKALAEEFERIKLAYSREYRIPIKYRTKVVGTYIPDFVVENKIIVELKALPRISNVEIKQLWNYLKGSDFSLALLVNWSFTTIDIKRIVYEQARNPREVGEESASSPRSMPHLLSMTATPIPRTLALTIYGDLDLTVLDELPPGRKPIVTEVVAPRERDATYEKIRRELKSGRQCYVITPRIDEPDPDKEFAVQARSAKAEAKRLKEKIFSEYEIGVMHSKLKDAEKEKVMEDFKDGKINILVSTSVVEVGMNVPNATLIIIEGAERFGLAQLHQLRGRVLRSTHQAYCYVFTESSGPTVLQRLKALGQAKNGFELAEYDLKFRGAGELSGSQQWGVSDVAMEALQNLKMVEAARAEAKRLLEEDDTLSRHPLLQQHLTHRAKSGEEIHFE